MSSKSPPQTPSAHGNASAKQQNDVLMLGEAKPLPWWLQRQRNNDRLVESIMTVIACTPTDALPRLLGSVVVKLAVQVAEAGIPTRSWGNDMAKQVDIALHNLTQPAAFPVTGSLTSHNTQGDQMKNKTMACKLKNWPADRAAARVDKMEEETGVKGDERRHKKSASAQLIMTATEMTNKEVAEGIKMLLSVVGDVLGNISRGWVLGNISQGWVLQADNNSGKEDKGKAVESASSTPAPLASLRHALAAQRRSGTTQAGSGEASAQGGISEASAGPNTVAKRLGQLQFG